jgi:hypothetical protein
MSRRRRKRRACEEDEGEVHGYREGGGEEAMRVCVEREAWGREGWWENEDERIKNRKKKRKTESQETKQSCTYIDFF